MNYSLDMWLIFFFIYCFFGWIWECSYVSIRTKKLTNRGFMRGPVLPIYGFGAVLMVCVGMPLIKYPVAMFFAGLICASTLEYFTGAVMQKLFKVRYWDYSECFLNIKGHICLKASLAWGTFTLLMNYFAHKPIERLVMKVPSDVLHVIVFIFTILFVADYSLAFKTAMDLRDVIIAMDKIKEELDRMEKRLDVAIAFAEDSGHQAADAFKAKVEDNASQVKLRIEERMNDLEHKFEHARKQLSDMHIREELENLKDEYNESIELKRLEMLEQINEMKIYLLVSRNKLQESAKRRGMLYRNMIRNNALCSDKFAEILEEIKLKVEEHKKENKKP